MEQRTIRQWRTENGLIQRQGAERLGVTNISIGNGENGRNAPSAQQLIALGSVFGIPVEQIDFDRDVARAERERAMENVRGVRRDRPECLGQGREGAESAYDGEMYRPRAIRYDKDCGRPPPSFAEDDNSRGIASSHLRFR